MDRLPGSVAGFVALGPGGWRVLAFILRDARIRPERLGEAVAAEDGRKVLVCRHEEVELGFGKPEQLPVLDSSPAELCDGPHLTARELPLELPRQVFVEEDPPHATCARRARVA